MSARARVYADLKTSNFTILAQLKHTQTKTNQIKTKRKNIAIDRMHNTQKNRIFFTWFFCNTMWMTWVSIYRRVECVCVIFLFVFLFLSFSSTACTASTEFHILIAFVVDKKFIPIFFWNNYTRKTTQKSDLRLCIFFVLTLTRSPSCVACTDDDLSTKFSFDVLNSNGREMCVLYVSRMYTHTPNITTWYTKSIQTNRNKTKRNDTRMNKQRLCLCCVCVHVNVYLYAW